MSRARQVTLRISAALLIAVCAAAADAATLFDPRYRFRTFSTEHFIIYYHQGEERLAARLAAVAEDTWHAVGRPLGAKPPPLTHVVLVDQTELANGSAYPLPYNTIVVTASWPAGSELIGNTEDWLRLVFTHEFTHIVHLDRSRGWARIVRGLFGRVAYAFPNLYLPAWQIEGLATYQESAITGEGRLHAGDFRAIVTEAARARRFAPLDRINGGLTDWPGGLAHYAYGLGFHAYLAETYGPGTLAELAAATARRIPFTASRVFERIYGRSLGALWREYEASLLASAPAVRADDRTRRLTHHGFIVGGPRFTRPAEVIYSVRTPHGFPALNQLVLDGSAPRQLATRFLGATAGIGTTAIYFDQQEVRRNAGVYSDLYTLDRASGRVRRITSEARLLDPDLSPDEQTIAAVQQKPGQRDLVLIDTVRLKPDTTAVAPIVTLIAEEETQFNAPRWSPDGRTIAVERHRRGSQSEIVLVDVATRALRVVASDAKARWVTPAWTRDGGALIAAADLNDGPFNLYELRPFAGSERTRPTENSRARQLTHTTGGATWPDVAPDGRTIVYVGYTVDGFDLFQTPYPPPDAAMGAELARPIQPIHYVPDAHDDRAEQARPLHESVRSTAYSPVGTLAPTWWSPIIEGDRDQLRFGAATGGVDVLGYHGYAVTATWLASSPSGAPAIDRSKPDWQLFYVYDRWRPTVWLSASRATSFFAGPPSDRGVPSTATLREHQLEAGLALPVRHVRVAQTWLASVVRSVNDFAFPDRDATRNRTAARGAWALSSAHTYGYSISQERGGTIGLTGELVRRALGSSADAAAITADARAYLPALAPHHVLAVRIAGGVSNGDRDLRRAFDLGGASPNPGVVSFSRDAVSLLRGFGGGTFAGTRVALANIDYRWPIARPQRGAGTWPLFVHTVHAAVFADAGHAWTRRFSARDGKTSAGAELSLDLVAGYWFPFTATVGAAWGRDGADVVADRATAYFRFGRAF